MPEERTPFALVGTDKDDSGTSEVVQNSATKPKILLRKRAKSLKEPHPPALRSQLADELHMRFWSLEDKPGLQGSSNAGMFSTPPRLLLLTLCSIVAVPRRSLGTMLSNFLYMQVSAISEHT